MDLRRSDLGLLMSLDMLLAERNVTAAARRLGISQPALSAQLARLREIFADDLLVGNAHGMTPTPRAAELQAPLHDLLAELKELVSTELRFDPLTDTRRFCIAASDLGHHFVLPKLYAAFPSQAPNIVFDAVALSFDRLTERMERGEIDFAVTSAENAPQDFPGRLLVQDDFCLVCRRDHPQSRQAMTMETFCRLDHLIVRLDGGRFPDDVDAELKRLGGTRRVVGSVPNFLLVPSIIRSTDCVAIVPTELAMMHKADLRTLPLPIDVHPLSAYLSWHPRSKRDPGHRWMREFILDLVPGRHRTPAPED